MKRRFNQLEDEPVLRLQLAVDEPDKPPLEASTRLLHACSTCAFGLPRDSSTWDLSNLLIDGHPVSRDTVTAWLKVIYKQYEDVPFGEAVPPAPASATRLYQLLAFADAVGSSRGVVKACLGGPRGLEDLAFEVTVRGQKYQLTEGFVYHWSPPNENDSFNLMASNRLWGSNIITIGNVVNHMGSIAQQVVSQLEPLLYLAYRLQLAPLQEVLHAFIRGCTCTMHGILAGDMRSVLTPRVTAAAAEEGLVEEGLLQVLVAQRCSLTGHGFQGGLFEPVEAGFIVPPVLFEARVNRPLPGLTRGQDVSVTLSLQDSTLKVGNISYDFKLLVGAPVRKASSTDPSEALRWEGSIYMPPTEFGI